MIIICILKITVKLIPGVRRRLMKEFLGVIKVCSSSKSNSVGEGGLETQNNASLYIHMAFGVSHRADLMYQNSINMFT